MKKRGEVYWVDFDPSLGTEIRKRRPAVIVSVNSLNSRGYRYIAIPFTSNLKKVYPSEVVVQLPGGVSKAVVDQMTTISWQRVGRRICTLSPEDVKNLEKVVASVLGLNIDPGEKEEE